MTKIPWTNKSWNPVIGCTKIAEGCKNCYAETMAKRLYWMGMAELSKFPEYMRFEDGWKDGHIELCHHRLDQPLHWRKPCKIFVCSMGDLFHEKVPFEYVSNVLTIIAKSPRHCYQILTKRPKRMAEYFEEYEGVYVGKPIAEPVYFSLLNIWLGISISTQADADKNIPILLQIPAAVRFVSIEPMLERINIRKYLISGADGLPEEMEKYHDWLDWVIIGCESGPKRRPCSLEWIEDAVKQCDAAGVAPYVKQIEINGRVSKDPNEWPKWAQMQEYPKSNK